MGVPLQSDTVMIPGNSLSAGAKKKKVARTPVFSERNRQKKEAQLFIKVKKKQKQRSGGVYKLKFRTSNRGPAYPVFREGVAGWWWLNRSTLAE